MRNLLQRLYDQRLKTLYQRYERWFVPGMLLSGFLLDVVTFRTLQIETTLALLGGHAFIAGLAVFYNNVFDGGQQIPKGKFFQYLRFLFAFVAQLSIGSLLSSALLFYWYSGAFFASWPVLVLLVLLVTTNEVFRAAYLKPAVQLGLYVFVLFSYFSILLPFIFSSLSPWLFVLAGVVSTFLGILLARLLAQLVPTVKTEFPRIATAIVIVTIIMNTLYFLNVIPPIPLSVRDAGIYEDIQLHQGEYVLTGQTESWLGRLLPGQTIYTTPSENVFAYTAIYAPAELTTVIFHQWQFYDPIEGKWVDKDRLSFTIRGGRNEGFRGYTFKSRLTPGRWRVTVETSRGQVLGRVPFTVALPQ